MAELTSDKPVGKELGRVVGETNHLRAMFTSSRPPHVGEYVLVEYGEGKYVLGIVESSWIGNPLIGGEGLRPEFVDQAAAFNAEQHEYMMGQARLLSWLDTLLDKNKQEVKAPRYPPRPTARVYEASKEVLTKIFSRDPAHGWIRVGELVNHPGVPFYINADSVISRHLAVLAVTGAGKSNTVGVLLNRIVNDLRGTALVIDMHSEYAGIAGDNHTNIVRPRIHPAKLTLTEYINLLRLSEKATKQRMYLRKAYKELKKDPNAYKYPEKFLDLLLKKIYEELDNLRNGKEKLKGDESSIIDLANKFEDLMENYGGRLLTAEAPSELQSVISPGKANVLQLGSVDYDVADVVVYHYLTWLLNERKTWVTTGGEKGYPVPVLVVIEEAHILLPRNRSTLTKSVASRVAREGRKFGVGLALVSQRPKNIDEDALSQTNNKIILKLVEPEDQRYVQRASETLSDELMQMLPSLNVGEAIVVGMMTPLPALVKIDKAEGKRAGSDIMAHEEWLRYANSANEEKDKDFYEDLGF
jgi:DNA helicase HerA-like ATPase